MTKALGRAGFVVVGRKGSHIRLKKKTRDRTYIVIVPLHPGARLSRGLGVFVSLVLFLGLCSS